MSIKNNNLLSKGLSREVYIYRDVSIKYPSLSPFSPKVRYPEYPFSETRLSLEDNNVYCAVRECLNNMDLDKISFGTPQWNPFRSFISPYDHVLIKPNMVKQFHSLGLTMDCLITHGSVNRDEDFRASGSG